MGWIQKVSRYIHDRKNKSFRKEVQKEKQQKYLFRDTSAPSASSRSIWRFWERKSQVSPLRAKRSSFEEFHRLIQKPILFEKKALKKYSLTLGGIGIFLLSLSTYIIGYSPYFQITPSKVLISASNTGIDINLAYRAIEDIYGQNVLFFDQEKLAKNMQKYQWNLAQLSVDRMYPNGLKITLSSTPILYQTKLFGIENKTWWLSSNGILVPSSVSKPENLVWLVILTPITQDELFDYRAMVPLSTMNFIRLLETTLRTEWKDFTITRLAFLERESELHVTLASGTLLLFSLHDAGFSLEQADIEKWVREQLLSLKLYHEKNPTALTDGGLKYLDLRIIGKIFQCRPHDICTNNLRTIYGDIYR